MTNCNNHAWVQTCLYIPWQFIISWLILFLVLIYVAWQGLSMTLEGVDRHVEGTYICTADNTIGEPASASMSISVSYQPEIITEKVCNERKNRSGVGHRCDYDFPTVLRCLISTSLTLVTTLAALTTLLPALEYQHKVYLPHYLPLLPSAADHCAHWWRGQSGAGVHRTCPASSQGGLEER